MRSCIICGCTDLQACITESGPCWWMDEFEEDVCSACANEKEGKEMPELSIARTPEVIAAEINSIKEQTRRMVLANSIEIGRRLAEAKQMLPHGEWGKWLEENVDYSPSTANNLLNIFEQYASDQLSIFGDNVKSEAFANLSYTQAVALLGVPEEEREAFVVENKVEDMSTRELQKTIAEKKKLEKELKKAQQLAEKERKAKEKLSQSYEELEERSKAHAELAERLQTELDKNADGIDTEKINELQAALESSKIELEKQESKIKELENDLKKKPLEAATVEVVPESVEKELAELREKVKRQDNTAAVKFSLSFEALVGGFRDLLASLEEVGKTDKELQQKYKGAVQGLIDKMAGRL